MKKHSLTARLIISITLVLMLFPPMSCLIFSKTARLYARDTARQDLETIRERLVPLMDESFSEDIEPRGQVSTFLSEIGPLMANTGGSARLMILGTRMQMIYPRDTDARTAAEPLAEKITELMENAEAADIPDTLETDGEAYLLEIYETPENIPHVRYIIPYCPMSEVGTWVKSAARQVLIISAVLAAAALVILLLTAGGITRSLKRLCREAERIGGGSFERIEPPFNTAELEDLRLAMNGMSERLERSDKAQKSFFQNVSHEMRNPLMSISGYAQGIEQGIFSDPKDAAHTVLEESLRLTDTVNGLLSLSRLEADETELCLESVPLEDVLADCLDRINGLAVQNGISPKLLTFKKTAAVYGNEELLEKIFDNLLSNAVRYAKSTVTVAVSCSGDAVSVSVADDGDGIAEDALPHIFERGFKGKDGNFGIGLAIAYSAAKKMQGSLSAGNSANGGAVFTLTLKSAA